MRVPAQSPLRHRPFRRLAAGYGVGTLGDWAGEIALSVAVFAATGRADAVVALWMLHRWVPGLATPSLAGGVAKLPPRLLLPALAGVQAIAWAGMAVAVHHTAFALGAALVLLDGLIAPVTRVVLRTAILSVTRPLGLHREGNAVINVLFTGAAALGPALSGLLVAGAGTVPALLLDSASFLATAVLLTRVDLPMSEAAARDRGGHAGRIRLPGDVRVLLISGGVVMALMSSVLPIELAFIAGQLHGSEADFGAVLTGWGVGMVVGGVLVARLSRVSLPLLLAAGTAVEAIAYLGMGTAATVAIVVAFSAVGGIGNGLSGMAFVTCLQERAGERLLARVNALYEAAGTVCPGIGFAAGGLLAALAGPRAVYVLAGAGTLLVLAALIPAPTWRSPALSAPAPPR